MYIGIKIQVGTETGLEMNGIERLWISAVTQKHH